MGGMMQKLVLSWSWECKMFTTGQHLWRERGRIEQGKSQTSWLAAQYSLIKPLANLSQLLGTEHWPKQSSPNKVTWSGFVTFTLQSLTLKMVYLGWGASWKWVCRRLIPLPTAMQQIMPWRRDLQGISVLIRNCISLKHYFHVYLGNSSSRILAGLFSWVDG